MCRSLIIGMPNVGKTCFTLNFAEFLGLKQIRLTIKQPAGFMATQTYEIAEAREELISAEPNKTRSLHSLDLELPVKKGKGTLTLVDSCGLSDGIHPDYEVRRAMAQTISQIRESEIVLHIVDLTVVANDSKMRLPMIDSLILNYVSQKQAYAILANKIDVRGTEQALEHLQSDFHKLTIIPVSALYQTGFREVKSFVWHNL